MGSIRSAGVRGFRTVVAELGGNADDFAQRAGFPGHALDADDVSVPDSAMAAMLELAADELSCPDLGLRIATRQDVGLLGPLAFAVRSAATLGDALSSATAYLFVHSDGMKLTRRSDPHNERGVAAMQLDLPVTGYWPVQGTDLTMGFIHHTATSIAGGLYGLRTVELPYPPRADARVYEKFYGVPVHFDTPAALLRVWAGSASIPVRTRDDDLQRMALAMLHQRAPVETSAECSSLVYATLAQSLGTATPDIAAVAGRLNSHPRTLQRRLAREGTSFSRILDEVRRHRAKRLLVESQMPLSQVAALLGFGEQASLTRSARRWWGRSPSAVRLTAGRGAEVAQPGDEPGTPSE